jgi:eukaryotic-like serine/threonine-protein kinase
MPSGEEISKAGIANSAVGRPSPDEVMAALERVLASRNFREARRLNRFLRFIVEATLRGEGATLKEYVLALEVFDCGPDFDPKAYSKVRVQAGNLRSRLAEYYAAEGLGDPVLIEIPKGSYVPVFTARQPEVQATADLPPETRRTAARPPWVAAVSLAGLLLIAVALAYSGRTHQAAQVPLRRSVAVLGFDNLSGRADAGWLSAAFSEMLTTELGASSLRTIPGEEVARMQKDLALPSAEALSRETLTRVRRVLGADMVIVGGYTVLPAHADGNGRQIRLDLRVQNTTTGETVKSFAQTGSEAGLFDLVSLAGAQLRGSLGVEPAPAAVAMGLRAAQPSTPEAVRLYYEGLSRMRSYDWVGAKDLLQRAAASDPSFPLAHSALSEVWDVLVYKERSAEEAKTAFDLSPSLPLEERRLVEARYRAVRGQWGKAEQIYEELFGRSPDNLEYGLRLVDAQANQQKLRAVLATLGRLRRLPVPLCDDPRIDLQESLAYMRLQKQDEALRAASQAERKTRTEGARRLVAEARLMQAGAWQSQGDLPRARDAALETRRICTELGDQTCVARAIARLGILEVGVNMAEAEKLFQESYETARSVGSYYAANALSNLGGALSMDGDCLGAERALDEASQGAQEARDDAFLVRLTINRESILLQAGKLRAAEDLCRRAAAIMDKGDNKMYLSANLVNWGDVLESEGDLAGAMLSRQRWLSLERAASGEVWKPLAQVAHTLLLRGDVGAARQTLLQAEAEARKAGNEDLRAEYINDFGGLALAEGRAAEGETIARQAEERSKARKRFEEAADACNLLAQCLLADGNVEAAKAAIDRAPRYLAGRCAAGTAFDISITAARAKAAMGNYQDRGNVAGALRNLDDVIAEAGKKNFAGVRMDARLARGEIQIQSGRAAKGRAELAALAQEAQAKGYGWIARRAAALGNAPLRPLP